MLRHDPFGGSRCARDPADPRGAASVAELHDRKRQGDRNRGREFVDDQEKEVEAEAEHCREQGG